MLYIIGGAPRCGKTKLARILSKKLNVPFFLTDLLRSEVLKKTRKNQVNLKFPFEKMFNGDQVDDCFKKYKPEDFLNADRREARTLFNEIREFIEDKIKQKQDYIIEGVHMLPNYIKKFGLRASECKIIYFGKIDKVKILKGLGINRDKDDWILGHIYRKITLKRVADMVSVYGKYFKKESSHYGFKFINTEEDFFNKINEAVKYFS